MNRRNFFRNLAASVATLVTAHALPLQKLARFTGPEEIAHWESVNVDGFPPDKLVAILYKREVALTQDGEVKVVRYTIQQA